MQYSQDSSRFAFGGSTNEVTICNSSDMSVLLQLKGSTECHAVCWHQLDDTLLLGFVDGYIQIRSTTEDVPGLKRMIHQQTVTSIAALPESDFAVSVDQFAQVAVWNSRTLELAGILFEPPLPPKDFVFVNPRLRVTDSGRLMLVYDDGVNGPQIVSWCLQQVTAPSRGK
jgi:WD40 repeat protein